MSGTEGELRELIERLRQDNTEILPGEVDLGDAAREWLNGRIDEKGCFRNPGEKLAVFAGEGERRVEVANLVEEFLEALAHGACAGGFGPDDGAERAAHGVVSAADAEAHLVSCGVLLWVGPHLVSRAALELFLSQHSVTVRQAVTDRILQKRAEVAGLIESRLEELASEEDRVVTTLEQGTITAEILYGHFLQIGPELIKALRASTHSVLSLARLRTDLQSDSTEVERGGTVCPLADDLVLFGVDFLKDALPGISARNPEIVKRTRELVRSDYSRRYQRLVASLQGVDLKALAELDRMIRRFQHNGGAAGEA